MTGVAAGVLISFIFNMSADFEKELLSVVNAVLSNNGRAPVDSLEPGADLRADLGLDSFDLAELAVRLQAKFDVDVFEGGGIRTPAQILERLSK